MVSFPILYVWDKGVSRQECTGVVCFRRIVINVFSVADSIFAIPQVTGVSDMKEV